MLTRICLIVAIVAGLAVAALNFIKVKDTITTLRTDLAEETSQKEQAQGERDAARRAEAATKKELESTKTELAATTDERDKYQSEADSQTKRANRVTEELAKTKQELNDTQIEMAVWNALGVSADQVRGMITDLKMTTQERDSLMESNKVNVAKIATLKNRLLQYEDPENYRVELPADLQGKVLVSDPKWDFVVLNIGQNQGVLENGILLVNRNGRLVAKVQVRNVQPNRSIANVLPNWKLGEVMEGDEVIP